uniref:Uncharacterized protein n=1 Tax=Timema poppense TaxID=170557 RepID=A0A7R9DSL3_TIMPO|nr:unnamed protein product [Timema poppensis]
MEHMFHGIVFAARWETTHEQIHLICFPQSPYPLSRQPHDVSSYACSKRLTEQMLCCQYAGTCCNMLNDPLLNSNYFPGTCLCNDTRIA